MRDMVDQETSAGLIRDARRSAQMTQAELATLANTSQSAVAAYEGGSRQPTLPVLTRMILASGHVLDIAVEPDPTLFRLTDLGEAIKATDDEQHRLRLVFEFLRAAADDDQPVRLLVAAEPRSTNDNRFDALFAAIAEDLSVAAGIRPPSWVHADERFLHGFWWVSTLPSARARAIVHTPASYRRRGIMIDRHDLVAA